MPAASKRTRHSEQEDENAPPSTSTRSAPRRGASASSSSSSSSTAPSRSNSSRPALTRSTTSLNPSSPLTRSTSFQSTPAHHTRRSSSSSSSASSASGPSTPVTPYTPLTMGGGNSRGAGAGVLVRTQSTPTIGGAGAASLKSLVAGGGSSGGRDKGDDGEDLFGGPRKYGRGKENIPPKKDSEEENSRKRLRVSRTASIGRGRSGSVASVRSESSSIGRHPSLGASSSFSRPQNFYPSPSPSPSNATSNSVDTSSVTSMDPLDLLERDEIDLDRTPTKPRTIPRRTLTLPTPPPSSPREDAELEATAHGIEMIRVKSSISQASTDIDIDIEELPEAEVKAKNPYRHLKSFLRLSSTQSRAPTDQVIVGREDEKAILRSYLSLRGRSDVGLYVSGPPGTGKTALVTALGREMGSEGWKVVELGCMGMKVGDLWTRLGAALGCEQSEEGVMDCVKGSDRDTLIILDEIDSLLPPPPILPTSTTSHLLSKIFSLPLFSSPTATIKLISISNTLDLTVRARLVLPEGAQPQVLPFKAYIAGDMGSIINSRLATASAGLTEEQALKVDAKAVELLTRKVEAQNGDLRMCLGCMSTAVNLAETEWIKKAFQADTDSSTPLIKVALPHILKAFNSHTQQLKAAAGTTTTGTVSPTGKKIRSVPLQGKMVLVSILIYLSRTRVGLPGCPSTGSSGSSPNTTPTKGGDLTTASLYATYAHLLSHHSSPFPPAAESDYRDLLSNLETLGLVAIGGATSMSRSSSSISARGKAASAPKIELCAREDEVKDGLGLSVQGIAKGSADAEVSKIWAREEEKVERARTKAAMALEPRDDAL